MYRHPPFGEGALSRRPSFFRIQLNQLLPTLALHPAAGDNASSALEVADHLP